MSIRDWFNKTPTADGPTVDGPTKEELRKAAERLEREQAITKAVYGRSHVERPKRTDAPQLPNYNNYEPYYHIVSFSDEYGFKLTQYPKHQKEEAYALFNNYNEAWHTPNNIFFFEGEEIGHIILGGKL